MKCYRCGNEDINYFYYDQKEWYCRKCIQFGRLAANTLPNKDSYQLKRHRLKPQLDFPLTLKQAQLSKQLVKSNAKETLVFAVCGAGKSEIVMEVIADYLNKGKRVGFAIARRQVVLELYERFKKAFKSIKVIPVCEGYTNEVHADLIVCTMHQLYRYYDAFDLLIMDEIDAFPYAGNPLLETIALASCRGRIIYLSATPDKAMLERARGGMIELLELFERPHGYPLVEPQPIFKPKIIMPYYLYRIVTTNLQNKRSLLIFTPTIALCKQIAFWISLFCECIYITSQSLNSAELIKAFRNHQASIMVATSVMERGVTFPGIDVCIYQCDHPVFNTAALIQMLGRVGRSFADPSGHAYLIGNLKNQSVKECQKMIRMMNDER